MREQSEPNIHVDVVGEGPALLCLPGFGNANWIFEKWIDPLAKEFRLVMPDNRGLGKSPPCTERYEIADLAADALAVMDHLGVERFGVVGLSMGGFIAQHLALKAPERTAALLLLCTTSGGERFAPHFPLMTEEQLRAIYDLDPETRVRAALDPALVPHLAGRFPEIYDYLVRMRVERVEALPQILLQYHAVASFLQTPLPLERIQAPTLIMGGADDLVVPAENAHLLAEAIPEASVEFFPQTDHMFFLEELQAVTDAMRGFFQKNLAPLPTN